ncbi:MAG: hypothetical protein HY280_07315 [Nitrospinae bacterium]|nr:hypothetical protein [Nitrospinota bacterium]
MIGKGHMRNFIAVLGLVFLVGASTGALAADGVEAVFPLPRADYSADDKTTFNADGYEYKVFYSQGKMRSEYDYATPNGTKVTEVAINRVDLKLSWTLKPDVKMYVTMKNRDKVPFAMLQTDGLINVYQYDRVGQKPQGEEKINGVTAAKYKVWMENEKGKRLEGFVWRTKDDITVRVDVSESGKPGKSNRLFRELKNLKVAKQNPAFFEIPSGYKESAEGYVK